MSLFHGQFNRFIWTGAFNTVNGYIWILSLQLLTGKPLTANILGYSIAAAIGYFAHAKFTFKQKPSWRNAWGYSLVTGISYLANLAVLSYGLSKVPPLLAQTIAISTFVVLNYLGQSRFAFTKPRAYED